MLDFTGALFSLLVPSLPAFNFLYANACTLSYTYTNTPLLLSQVVTGVDALSRDALRTLAVSIGLRGNSVPGPLKALAPKLSAKDQKVVENIQRLLSFFLGDRNGNARPLPGSLSGQAGSGGFASSLFGR
jgi:hypothetical protein